MKKILRKVLSFLPPELRYTLLKRFVRVQQDWPSPSLEIAIASTEEELSAAYRLLHDSYVKSGYMDPHPSGMRVLPHHLLPQNTTIVAKWDGVVIATVSLIRDNSMGLPMEKAFDLSGRRQGGRRLAEVSSLAVDPNYRGQASRALFPLFRYIYQYSKYWFGTQEFVIAVHPSMMDMYIAFMSFKCLEKSTKKYSLVKGAPAVGLYLNFKEGEERCRKDFMGRPDSSNLYKYWLSEPLGAQNRFPERRYNICSDPILTPDLLQNFFLEKAQLKNILTLSEMRFILNAYSDPKYGEVLGKYHAINQESRLRIDSQMEATVGPRGYMGEVRNVSQHGFLLNSSDPALSVGQVIFVRIWLNPTQTTEVRGKICWRSEDGFYGVRIFSASPEWIEMFKEIGYYEKIYQGETRNLSRRTSKKG